MICVLAKNLEDAHEFLELHPGVKDKHYIVVTPESYMERMGGLYFSDIVYTEEFLATPNQDEIWIQARSRLRGQSTHRSGK